MTFVTSAFVAPLLPFPSRPSLGLSFKVCRRPSVTMLDSDKNKGEEDILLARELRRKVDQLYGGAENVAMRSTADGVEFRVLRQPERDEEAQVRSAWGVIASICVAAVVSIAGFAALVQVGAVHDSSIGDREYSMPAYGSSSYVNPYEMLDREFEESLKE